MDEDALDKAVARFKKALKLHKRYLEWKEKTRNAKTWAEEKRMKK